MMLDANSTSQSRNPRVPPPSHGVDAHTASTVFWFAAASVFLAAISLWLGACALLPPALRGDTAPGWVRHDVAIYPGKKPGLVYASGAASGIADPVLRREAAEAAARAALAQRISAHVSTELRAYAASTGTAFGEAAERHTDRTVRQHAAAELRGARVVERFVEPDGRVEYALVAMESSALSAAFREAGLPDDVRERVRRAAEAAFTRAKEQGAHPAASR